MSFADPDEALGSFQVLAMRSVRVPTPPMSVANVLPQLAGNILRSGRGE